MRRKKRRFEKKLIKAKIMLNLRIKNSIKCLKRLIKTSMISKKTSITTTIKKRSKKWRFPSKRMKISLISQRSKNGTQLMTSKTWMLSLKKR